MNVKSKLPPHLQKYFSFGTIIKVILLPFALVFFAGVFIIRPFVVVKFFKINPWRLGHLLSEPEVTRLKALNRQGLRRQIVLYYFPERKVANAYVIKMWRRTLPTISGNWGWLIYEIAAHLRFISLVISPNIRDDEFLSTKFSTGLKFSESEEGEGKRFLESIGCGDSRFVCLMVRDSSYLESIRTDKNFNFYKFRDSEIETYVQAAESLANAGYKVFRMGQIVKKSINTAHPNIIDYATNGMRTEFLDIYLGAKCSFCISTCCGFDNIPLIFRRPIMFVNVIGFSEDLITNPFIIYPKLYIDQNSGKSLNLREIADRGIQDEVHDFEIEMTQTKIRDLSAEEIKDAALEMMARVEGRYSPTKENKQNQKKTENIFAVTPSLKTPLFKGSLRGEFATCFLNRYPNFLD